MESNEQIAFGIYKEITGSTGHKDVVLCTLIMKALDDKDLIIKQQEGEIAQIKECLKRYADADYKGEWNDVDGGFSARLLLANLEWTTAGEWRCSEHLESVHPHGECPGPGIPLPEAMEEINRRSW